MMNGMCGGYGGYDQYVSPPVCHHMGGNYMGAESCGGGGIPYGLSGLITQMFGGDAACKGSPSSGGAALPCFGGGTNFYSTIPATCNCHMMCCKNTSNNINVMNKSVYSLSYEHPTKDKCNLPRNGLSDEPAFVWPSLSDLSGPKAQKLPNRENVQPCKPACYDTDSIFSAAQQEVEIPHQMSSNNNNKGCCSSASPKAATNHISKPNCCPIFSKPPVPCHPPPPCKADPPKTECLCRSYMMSGCTSGAISCGSKFYDERTAADNRGDDDSDANANNANRSSVYPNGASTMGMSRGRGSAPKTRDNSTGAFSGISNVSQRTGNADRSSNARVSLASRRLTNDEKYRAAKRKSTIRDESQRRSRQSTASRMSGFTKCGIYGAESYDESDTSENSESINAQGYNEGNEENIPRALSGFTHAGIYGATTEPSNNRIIGIGNAKDRSSGFINEDVYGQRGRASRSTVQSGRTPFNSICEQREAPGSISIGRGDDIDEESIHVQQSFNLMPQVRDVRSISEAYPNMHNKAQSVVYSTRDLAGPDHEDDVAVDRMADNENDCCHDMATDKTGRSVDYGGRYDRIGSNGSRGRHATLNASEMDRTVIRNMMHSKQDLQHLTMQQLLQQQTSEFADLRNNQEHELRRLHDQPPSSDLREQIERLLQKQQSEQLEMQAIDKEQQADLNGINGVQDDDYNAYGQDGRQRSRASHVSGLYNPIVETNGILQSRISRGISIDQKSRHSEISKRSGAPCIGNAEDKYKRASSIKSSSLYRGNSPDDESDYDCHLRRPTGSISPTVEDDVYRSRGRSLFKDSERGRIKSRDSGRSRSTLGDNAWPRQSGSRGRNCDQSGTSYDYGERRSTFRDGPLSETTSSMASIAHKKYKYDDELECPIVSREKLSITSHPRSSASNSVCPFTSRVECDMFDSTFDIDREVAAAEHQRQLDAQAAAAQRRMDAESAERTAAIQRDTDAANSARQRAADAAAMDAIKKKEEAAVEAAKQRAADALAAADQRRWDAEAAAQAAALQREADAAAAAKQRAIDAAAAAEARRNVKAAGAVERKRQESLLIQMEKREQEFAQAAVRRREAEEEAMMQVRKREEEANKAARRRQSEQEADTRRRSVELADLAEKRKSAELAAAEASRKRSEARRRRSSDDAVKQALCCQCEHEAEQDWQQQECEAEAQIFEEIYSAEEKRRQENCQAEKVYRQITREAKEVQRRLIEHKKLEKARHKEENKLKKQRKEAEKRMRKQQMQRSKTSMRDSPRSLATHTSNEIEYPDQCQENRKCTKVFGCPIQ